MSVKVLLALFISSSVFATSYYVESKDGKIQSYKIDSELVAVNEIPVSPLGSIWKLFAFAYLKETKSATPPFTCKGVQKEETFCCAKGETIDMSTALARSCGLYFAPERLKVSDSKWKEFWKHKGITNNWLMDYNRLHQGVDVPVKELLSALEKIESSAYSEPLRNVVLKGTANQGLPYFGSYPRVKTFTWDDPQDPNKFVGGFAGWLPDKTFVWLLGNGKSHEVISKVAPILEKHWSFEEAGETECVNVQFFQRYPIAKILDAKTQAPITSGNLRNDFIVYFKNGKKFDVTGSEELKVNTWNGSLFITGKLNLTNYIARVVDREFNHRDENASLALSIVARTYLYQNAKRSTACYEAPDTSAFQRVSASRPSKESLRIARKTADIILNEKGIRYHATDAGRKRISWKGAVNLQNQQKTFPDILRAYFPNATLELHGNKTQSECQELVKANQWLRREEKRWKRELQSMIGFEFPESTKVCRSTVGSPFTNIKENEIYIEHFEESEDLISLTHEWLHIAFQNHPMRNDEFRIDELAKKMNVKR